MNFNTNNVHDGRFCNKLRFKIAQSGNLLNLKHQVQVRPLATLILTRIIPLILERGRSGGNREENV